MSRRKEVPIGDWIIRVDPDAVRRLYKDALIDWCQCDRCTNWRLTRDRFFPKDAKSILQSLGLQLGNSLSQTERSSRATPNDLTPYPNVKTIGESGYYRRHPYYIVPGVIIKKGKSPIRLSDRTIVSISTGETESERLYRLDNLPNLKEPLIYARTSVTLPWLRGEIRWFKFEQTAVCPQCMATDWRVVGRLKCASKIPGWYGVELGARPQDFDVAFCWKCGTPQFSRRVD